MIYDNEKKQQAREIIEKHHLIFLARTIGLDHLSDEDISKLKRMGIDPDRLVADDFVKDAYDVGRTRAQPKEGIYTPLSINDFRLQPKPYVSEESKYAIDYVKSQVVNATQRLSTKIQQDVEGKIREANLKYRNFVMDEAAAPIVVQGIERNKTINEVASDLRDGIDDYDRDWRRVSTTELNNAHSHGSAEMFRQMNKDKKSDEIYVFKRVVDDEALCPHCRRAYLKADGVTPKIFTLKQLQANGTNYGKKASAYQPVVGAHHPNCRCHLNMLPQGFGFDDEGSMEFKEASHKPEVDE